MRYASKSPWVIHYDASSCNGCDIEVLAALCPGYDAERFGVINTGNPKHADIFLITGSVNAQNISVIKEIYDQMLEPKVVVACGVCACSGGVFHDCYNVLGGADHAIPVDVYAPGCAVRPEAIIDAVVKAVAILDQKSEKLAAERKQKRADQRAAFKNLFHKKPQAEAVLVATETFVEKVACDVQEPASTDDCAPLQDATQSFSEAVCQPTQVQPTSEVKGEE